MIFSFEKKLLEWLEKKFYYIAFAFIVFLGVLIRYALREVISPDGVYAYLPWYEEIKANGGLRALAHQVGDYNIFYQFLIALMTYLPFAPITGYKLLSIIFDIAMAVLFAKTFYDLDKKKSEWSLLLGFALVWINPMVFINSSEWGQCDVIYTFFCILAVLQFINEKYFKAAIWLACGFVFKLQAVFVMPFFLLGYFLKKKFSCIYFGLIPMFMIITSIPGLIMGRSIIEVFTVYAGQAADDADSLFINYPSFWAMFIKDHNAPFIKTAIFLTVGILLLIMFYIYKNQMFTKENMLSIAFILAFTTVLFLPKMRERYGFLYTVLSMPIALKNRKTISLCIGLHLIALLSYGVVELGSPASLKGLAIANFVIYIMYLHYLIKGWKENN